MPETLPTVEQLEAVFHAGIGPHLRRVGPAGDTGTPRPRRVQRYSSMTHREWPGPKCLVSQRR